MTNYLITGGAGFIGSNYAARQLQRGQHVTIYDNLSRAGNERNLDWLRSTFGPDSFDLIRADVCDAQRLAQAAASVDVLVHLAAQVAVTTSVINPRDDFECNALGTFNAVEAARLSPSKPILIYASTNKVYGGMEDLRIEKTATNYRYADLPFGVAETYPLDFHSPYGCSKGAGDQYVRDYARIYGLRTVVFRQSCIYGPRQFGVEDQGWLAWFIIAAVLGKPISIYGDGKQVRDVLYVDDLLDAYDLAVQNIDQVSGSVFNVGGGPANTISVWSEFAPMLEKLKGEKIIVRWGDWRPGDQRIYVSDIRKARQQLGWEPHVSVQAGIERLYRWVSENRQLFT